jgi:hypothetical protein
MLFVATKLLHRTKTPFRSIFCKHEGTKKLLIHGRCAIRHNMSVEKYPAQFTPPSRQGTECVAGNRVRFSLPYPHSVPDGTAGTVAICIFYQHIVPAAQGRYFLLLRQGSILSQLSRQVEPVGIKSARHSLAPTGELPQPSLRRR